MPGDVSTTRTQHARTQHAGSLRGKAGFKESAGSQITSDLLATPGITRAMAAIAGLGRMCYWQGVEIAEDEAPELS